MAWTTVFPAFAGNTTSVEGMDEAAIKNINPNAKVIHVTEEEYPLLAERLEQDGYRSNSNPPNNYPRQGKQDCDRGYRQGGSESSNSLNVMVDFSNDMLANGDGDGAEVLYVFIGAVLVVVWTFYVFKYLYDISMGAHPCRWSELSFTSSHLTTNSDQHGYFNGLNFRTGIQDGGTEIGLSAEFGHSDILLTENDSLRLKGFYWLLGPILRWRFSSGKNPHYLKMDFVAGSTEHEEMGVIAKATMGIRFALSEHAHLSLNWGAMNINLKNTQGIINDKNQYHNLFGINIGYLF